MLIEKLLKTYDDEHLAKTLRAAENDEIVHDSKLRCLLSLHQLGYGEARHVPLGVHTFPGGTGPTFGWNAEAEFCNLATNDSERNTKLVPLVQNELLARLARNGEQYFTFAGMRVLLTTASTKHECQQWDWWEAADAIVRVDQRGASVLRGEADRKPPSEGA